MDEILKAIRTLLINSFAGPPKLIKLIEIMSQDEMYLWKGWDQTPSIIIIPEGEQPMEPGIAAMTSTRNHMVRIVIHMRSTRLNQTRLEGSDTYMNIYQIQSKMLEALASDKTLSGLAIVGTVFGEAKNNDYNDPKNVPYTQIEHTIKYGELVPWTGPVNNQKSIDPDIIENPEIWC